MHLSLDALHGWQTPARPGGGHSHNFSALAQLLQSGFGPGGLCACFFSLLTGQHYSDPSQSQLTLVGGGAFGSCCFRVLARSRDCKPDMSDTEA